MILVKNEAIANNAMETLMKKAMGGRSMSEFAKACDVSPMSISRIMSGTKPSKKMCLKMSSDLYVKSIGLTSREFMEAAGYTDEEEIENVSTYEQMLTQRLDTMAVGLISQRLMERQATYKIVPSIGDAEFDYEIHINEGDVNSWSIVLDKKNHTGDDVKKRLSLYYYLGRILSLKEDDKKQYSMILSDKELYEILLKNIDRDMVKANVSVAYLDSDRMQVLQEDHIGSGDFISLVDKI